MNPLDERQDEEQLASLLNTVNQNMPAPTREFLDRLLEQSTEAYRSAFLQQTSAVKERPAEKKPVRFLPWPRLLPAGLAAALLLALGLWVWLAPPTKAQAFGEAIEKMAQTGTFHLQVTREGKTSDAWIRGERLRRDRPDGTYEIAVGSRSWLIDEKTNRATPQSSSYFREGETPGPNLFPLIGPELSAEDWKGLVSQKTAAKVQRQGQEYYLYRTEAKWGKGPARVEALVDCVTLLPHSIRLVRPNGEPAEPLAEILFLGKSRETGDEDKFVVNDTLTEDGRVGKVADVQGVVSLRPVLQQRWTPLSADMLLKPGDWVRTDLRGANAVLLRLVKQTTLTLGPGSLAEIVSPTQVRVHQGDIEVNVPKGNIFELVALNGQRYPIQGNLTYRCEENRIVLLEKPPLWLQGFKGAIPQESIGSLVALVDGRNVPLTVGYHKVSVDIRDQIARTIIEESFVNHTDGVLEGTFHFPLPQDASISGFGMWIGDNLVEADIVEKQRAREIFEIILREKRDPGLLEWTGGNIFKARVYPIPAHAEKRVKITYTQVLPLRGNSYRYSYSLQSEMLKQHPLRQLDLDVKIHSAMPLKNVSSPTHMTRNEKTAHSARLEFSAQEYTPSRDFEVVVEVEGQQGEVVLIPHRRGEDGYFLLQVLPPAAANGPERAVLSDGAPLRLLILADTSASMSAGQRAEQEAFLAALLGGLTPRDQLNLAACDVECDWAFAQPVPATAENIAAARRLLSGRVSLGWTDLDKAFSSAFGQCSPGTHVVYIGDGIVTTGDADPAAFAQRLQRLYQAEGRGALCHAVSVGSSFESGVLKAVGGLGGGSVRRITVEQGPVPTAREFLDELTQPGLRDLKVEFTGLRTARVYPEELPNLPAGSQQILLGRYLPEGKDQVGDVTVTGRLGNQPFRLSHRVSLKDAEEGNSFIPRLWARMHLDRLLQKGASEAVRDEIIALSEEYQIITPFTSFLVLESDADRERFGVKRRFRMRDGEKFFAQGRDNAQFELTQQQMKRAGEWRLGLRRAALRQLAGLGRNSRLFQDPNRLSFPMSGSGPAPYSWDRKPLELFLGNGEFAGREYNAPGGGSLGIDWYEDTGGIQGIRGDRLTRGLSLSESGEGTLDPQDARGFDSDFSPETEPGVIPFFQKFNEVSEPLERQLNGLGAVRSISGPGSMESMDDILDGSLLSRSGLVRDTELSPEAAPAMGMGGGGGRLGRRPSPYESRRISLQWLDSLFPSLPAPMKTQKEPKPTWPEAARQLTRSLLRTGHLAKLKGGLEIAQQTDSFDPRWNQLSQRSQRRDLFSSARWLTRSDDDRTATMLQWCDARERGILDRALGLGRIRSSKPVDLSRPPLELNDFSLSPLDEGYRGYEVSIEPQKEGRVRLVLRPGSVSTLDICLVIDTRRHVLLSLEHRNKGKTTLGTRFEDFVEVAGCWWARKVETYDDQGRRTSLTTFAIRELAIKDFDQQIQQELVLRTPVLFLRQPLPSLIEAKRNLAAGKLTFEDRIALVRHFAAIQQWTRAGEHLQKAAELAQGKAGMKWLQDGFLEASRRHEELKKRLFAEAERLAAQPGGGPIGNDVYALAGHVFNQAARLLPAQELFGLLDRIKPLYGRQPPQMQAMKGWTELRVNYLGNMGQADEALRLRKQLATDYPHDLDVQRSYAQALVNAGDFTAAYEWLKRMDRPEARWLPSEEESLRDLFASFLRQEGRYTDLAGYLEKWVGQNPRSSSPYAQYLAALIRSDQVNKAHRLMAQWLKEGQVQGDLAPATMARLEAAINLALGRGHDLYTNRIEERWLAPLAEVVLFFARRPADLHRAANIMSSSFSSSDDSRRVRQVIAGILAGEFQKQTPAQIQTFVGWVLSDNPPLEKKFWKKLAADLTGRWTGERKAEIKNQVGHTLLQVLASKGSLEERLAFLRRQLNEGPEDFRSNYAWDLFRVLLQQPWSEVFEVEGFSLLDRVPGNQEGQDRLMPQVTALHQLTNRLLQTRFEALMKKAEHPENLPRTEFAKKQQENRKLARQGLADRLRQEAGKHGQALEPWLAAERLYLEVLLERDLKQAASQCWTFLGEKPPAQADLSPEEEQTSPVLNALLHHRFLLTLTNLAARKEADPALAERLLTYIDKGIAADTEEGRWKQLKYQLLIALDRPKDLEKALRGWIQAGDPDNRWRVALAYLLVEQGKVAKGVQLLETVEKADDLGPAAYRILAGWYLALGRRELYERASINSYKVQEEYQLDRMLRSRLYPWQRGEGRLPSGLDREVLLMYAALFEKASSPANYLWSLQQFYQATRDFRLLAVLADAVVGHSAGKVYPFLQGMRGIISEIHDEATVDQLGAHLTTLRNRAKTPVDRRALDLLEVQVRRRAAELKNQPGPHVQAALVSLQRAFTHEWTEGEPRLMASLLASLGTITPEPLAREQLRQLEVLHQRALAGSVDRLFIGHSRGQALWSYNRRDEALDLLETALKEFQEANKGVLPVSANDVLSTFVSYLEQAGHYDRGEKYLLAQLQHPVHQQQMFWLTERLYSLYHHALSNDGVVSFGQGQILYQALKSKLRDALATENQNHRHQLVNSLCQVFRTAAFRKLAGAHADLRTFAFKEFPEPLRRQTNHYDSMVSTVSRTVRDVLGKAEGIAFLLDRVENEPAWLGFNNQDGWSRHCWTLAIWRHEAKSLPGDIETRLLRFVLGELRRDLESRQQRNRVIYNRSNSYYWVEKEADFVKTAEEVLAQRGGTSASVEYIAEYLYRGTFRLDRAIAALLAAQAKKILYEGGQAQLVRYLHEANRFAESIPLLVPLVAKRPDDLDYRVWLMRAYFKVGRTKDLLALLKDTDAFFHKDRRWTEGAMASLGHSTLDNQLFEQSVAYYREAIDFRQKTQPNRGVGDGTLSGYYANQARAYAGLGKTPEAVEAATSALVAWGRDQRNRTEALNSLLQVLRESRDLQGFVAFLDKKEQESKLHNPVVRKALGQVLAEKGKHREAVAQLQLAAAVQPNDAQTYELLLASLDKLGDKEGIFRALLQAVQLRPREISLYRDMGRRLESMDRPREVERAYTSIVEVQPNEAESHALLAEVRQKQNRWGEAIVQWGHAARLRALEPDGLLKLAAAQIHERLWDQAEEAVRKLRSRGWPSRFSTLEQEIRNLEQQIVNGRRTQS